MPEQSKTSEYTIYCACECGYGFKVDIRREEDDGVAVLSTIIAGSTAYQSGLRSSIKRRIKGALFLLLGKEYVLHDIYMTKRQWEEFVAFVNGKGGATE